MYRNNNAKEMTILPNLRTFTTERLGTTYPSGVEPCIIAWLLRGMPWIEELRFGSSASGSVASMPKMGQALQNCPTSLRRLHLAEFRLTKASLSGIDPDRIECIALKNCGDNSNALLDVFRRSANICASITQDGDAICLVKQA